jgi:erythromycin esterase-like protein
MPAVGTPPAQVQDIQEQVDKWKKLYEEAHAAAAAREAELKHPVREPTSGDNQQNMLVQEVEKLKKMHERAVAQIEQMKSRQAADQPAGNDTVPRARIEDAVRKLAQTERNYQQLLKTLNRSFGARSSGQPVPQADNIQRRDVS